MDWSRAKNILIAMLLIADLVIGGFYLSSVHTEKAEAKSKIEAAEYYLGLNSIELQCEIPSAPSKLAVVSVSFLGESDPEASCCLDFGGRKLEVAGLAEGAITELKSGIGKVEIRSCAYALIQAAGDLPSAGCNKITGIELVYYVSRLGYTETEGEDTALPYWKVVSGAKSFYYAAFNN